jgi:hypothetical protein
MNSLVSKSQQSLYVFEFLGIESFRDCSKSTMGNLPSLRLGIVLQEKVDVPVTAS